MNTHRSILLALAVLATPLAASASETLTYTSSDFTSSYTTGNFPGEVGVGSYFTADLTLSGPLAANLNDANLSSEVTSLAFTVIDPTAPSADRTEVLNLSALQAEGSKFSFSTNSAGTITGWNFTAGITDPSLSSTSDVLFHSCSNESCAPGSYNAQNFGGTGDWYDSEPGSSTASDGCTYNPSAGCGSGGGAGSVGSWSTSGVVSAPELDPATAATAIVLLIGSIIVLNARRKAVIPKSAENSART